MTLPIDTESRDYKFLKTLNEDVELTSNEYGEWDLVFKDGDYSNVSGLKSLKNACIIAILTRYNELKDIPTYTEFGDRAYEVLKDNQNKLTTFKIETDIIEVLENMRRVRTVDIVEVIPDENTYQVNFGVTSITDEIVQGSVSL